MSDRPAPSKLLLTKTAIDDLLAIEAYSITHWGKSVAAEYLGDFEQALARIQVNPDLLRPEIGFHAQLSFYRVNKHLLVCERNDALIIVLTVINASHDIPGRLAELAPTLAAEAELLHQQLNKPRKSPRRR